VGPGRVGFGMSGFAWLWMVGCYDLAALEDEQQSLEKEVEVLRRNVEEMRALMQAMDALPDGPSADERADDDPANDLARAIPLTVERTGDPPQLPPTGPPERRDNTACGYRFAVPWLEALSDQALEMAGAGRASPLVLTQDGKPLSPHAGPLAFERNCRGAFRHQPRFVFFSAADAVDNVGGSWALQLSEEVPLPLGNDGEAHWVYPGTELRFAFDAGWRAEAWGPMRVTVDARLLYVGSPEAPDALGSGEARIAFLDLDRSGSDPRLTLTHTPPNPDQPWVLTVSSPADGPYVLIDTLTLGNDEHSLIVAASPGAGPDGDQAEPEAEE
jgi:hypothetical protein